MVSTFSEPPMVEAIKAAKLTQLGEVEILWSTSARHDTALVRTSEGQIWFVKTQGKSLMTNKHLSLEGEIDFHRTFAQNHFPKELRCFVPPLVSVIDKRTLIFCGYPNHLSLHSILLERTPDLNGIGLVGQFLAGVHSIPVDEGYRTSTSPVVTHGHVTPERLVNTPASYARLLRLIQQAPNFNEQLRKLRDSWKVNGLIHGDIKVDHVLVNANDKSGERIPLIVDWELSSRGDTRWDCGSLIGSIYMTWLIRCYVDDHESNDDDTKELAQDYVKALLHSYLEHSHGAVDISLILAWAGYWLTQQILGILPLHEGLSRFELATMHLAQQLLSEIDVSN